MGTVRQIAVNMVTGWVAVIVRTGIAIFIVPFLLSHLGKEGYGLIGLLGIAVSMAGVADLGLRAALGRELAEQVARRDKQAFSELASTALLLYLGVASVLATAGWMLAPWFVTFFKVPEFLQADAILMIRIYGTTSIIISFITPVFSAALSSYHRFDLVNTVQIIGGMASSLMLFAVISFVDNPLYGWAGVMLIFQVVTLVLTAWFFHRVCDGAQIGVYYLNLARLRPLFKLGGSMYVLQMTQALAERSDPLVLSYFLGPGGVALYQPGGRLSSLIRPMVRTLADQMYPLTTKQHIDRQQQKMQRILIYGTRYTLLLGSLFTAGLLAFAKPFCRLWLGKSLGAEYQIAAQVMMGWALVDLMSYAAGTQWPVLLGMKRLKFLIWTQVPTAVLNILVSIYLVGFTKLGIPGVLVATIIIGLIRRPILSWYTARACGLRPLSYFRQSYLRPMLCLSVTLLGACLVRFLVHIESYFMLGISACVVAAIWGFSCLLFGFEAQERKQAFAFFMKRYSRGGER